MSEGRRIVRSAISTYGVRLALALNVLLLTPYLFRTLGASGFGTWSVVYTIASIFALVEFGFSTGATKLIAELRGASRRRELHETVGTSVALMAAMGGVACAVFVAFGLLFDGIAGDTQRDEFRQSMLLLAATMLIRLPTATYGAILLGYQRASRFNAGEGLTALSFPIAAVVAVKLGGDVLAVTATYAASLLAGSATFLVLLRRTDRELPLRPRIGGPGSRRRVAGFASLTLLADAMLFVGTRLDTVYIAALRSAAAAAPFAAALKLQSGLQSLTFPIYLLFMPMVSELWGAGRKNEVRRRLVLATRIAAQVTLPAAFALALFADDVTSVWLGDGAPDITADIIAVLVATQAVTLVVSPAERMLIGIGKAKVMAAIAVVEGVSNVVVSIALISAYGAIGAAIGTMLTYGLVAPVKLPIAARALGMPTLAFLRCGIAPAVLSSLPGGAMMVAAWAFAPTEAARLLIGFVGGGAICAAIGVRQVGPQRLRETLASRRQASPPATAEAEIVDY